MEEQKKNTLKEYISKPEVTFFLSLIIPLTALAVTFGIMTARINYIEKTMSTLQNQYTAQSTTNSDIKVRLAEIQKDIIYMKEAFDRGRDK